MDYVLHDWIDYWVGPYCLQICRNHSMYALGTREYSVCSMYCKKSSCEKMTSMGSLRVIEIHMILWFIPEIHTSLVQCTEV